MASLRHDIGRDIIQQKPLRTVGNGKVMSDVFYRKGRGKNENNLQPDGYMKFIYIINRYSVPTTQKTEQASIKIITEIKLAK